MENGRDNSDTPIAELLATPVQFLTGVGPRRAEILARRNLKTTLDLLFFFPRDYQTVAPARRIKELAPGEDASVAGVIEEAELREFGNGKSNFGILVRQDSQCLRAVWFNQPFMARQLRRGQRVLLTGSPKRRASTWEMSHPRVEPLEDDAESTTAGLLPVYALTEGIRQGAMRRIVHAAVDKFAGRLDEVFSPEFLEEQGLLGISEALTQIDRGAGRGDRLRL